MPVCMSILFIHPAENCFRPTRVHEFFNFVDLTFRDNYIANIREFQNYISQSIIKSSRRVLSVPQSILKRSNIKYLNSFAGVEH